MNARQSVLVDSNIFIGLLRRRLDPSTVLGGWIGDGSLATCGMVRVEVERGLRAERVRARISGFFDVMILVPTSNPVWEDVARLAWRLDRNGRTLPPQDLLIAVCAMQLDGFVLTDDAHFSDIPGITVLSPSKELAEWGSS